MKQTDDHNLFIKDLKERFDRSVEAIEAETVSKITRARYQALEQKADKRSIFVWLPAGAVATLCLALVIYALVPRTQVEEKPALDEIELITNLDLYENFEFYAWLEEHELPS